jgi:hypothetical protein
MTIWMALAQDDGSQVERPVTREKHPVSPAVGDGAGPQTVAGRTRGPARHVDPALAVVDEFSMAVYGRSMFRSPGGGGDRDVPRLVEVTEPAVAGLTGVPGDG